MPPFIKLIFMKSFFFRVQLLFWKKKKNNTACIFLCTLLHLLYIKTRTLDNQWKIFDNVESLTEANKNVPSFT